LRDFLIILGGGGHFVAMGKRIAEAIKIRVEELNIASMAGHSIEPDCARGLASLSPALANKLAAVGLIAKREVATLCEFLKEYIEGRIDLNPSTLLNLSIVQGNLIAYFGKGRTLSSITAGEADEFRRHSLTTLKENTVRKRCSISKQFFNAALRNVIRRFNSSHASAL
jgi:hypothetical protein